MYSRRSPAGSIGANGGTRFSRLTRTLHPTFSGGLHCGRKPCGSLTPVPVCSRRPRRVPLRLVSPRVTREFYLLFPPVNGGLHSGLSPRVASAAPTSCSRRSSVDSIAARTGKPLRCRGAHVPASDGGLHCGEVEIGSDGNYARVLALFDGGLHCGIADWILQCRYETVLPPFNDRLHCGWTAPPRHRDKDPGAPAGQRRAPLRRRQVSPNGLVDVRAPAVRRRAPLRRPGRPHLVFPGQRCSRHHLGGLHCGLNQIARMPRCPTCAPAVRRRVPLQRRFRRPVHSARDACSRRPTAGSIAAA